MKSLTWKQSLAASLTLALGIVAGSASAAPTQNAQGARSVMVRYGDLDLTRDEGVQVLYARLRAAAKQVCSDDGSLDLGRRAAVRQCVDTALANAVAGVRNSQLAALHNAKDRRVKILPARTASLS